MRPPSVRAGAERPALPAVGFGGRQEQRASRDAVDDVIRAGHDAFLAEERQA